MPETREWLFEGENGLTAAFEFDQARRALSVDVTDRDGQSRRMVFNNVGDGDPVEFVAGLNWHYVRNGIFGALNREHDFLATVASLHEMTRNPEEHDLDRQAAAELRGSVVETMKRYDGDDELSSLALLPALERAGFIGDTHHMLRMRERDFVLSFRDEVWEPLKEGLSDYLESAESPFARADDCETPEI